MFPFLFFTETKFILFRDEIDKTSHSSIKFPPFFKNLGIKVSVIDCFTPLPFESYLYHLGISEHSQFKLSHPSLSFKDALWSFDLCIKLTLINFSI